MKSNAFNICPSCIYKNLCVLTTQKSQVWSCSEYDELAPETRVEIPCLSAGQAGLNTKKDVPEMAMA